MQRSSAKIGALATALAKAQSELANPEKSLVATLPSAAPGGPETSFRYASLAAGLDIVRKCLGQHEIATVQATTIDRDSGLIRLTTTLVHSSGEWMASDWPVCPAKETLHPHRMGAALTYARRYSLFTLVGIAGEDDLDAPDLQVTGPPIAHIQGKLTNGTGGSAGRSAGYPGGSAASRAPSGASAGTPRAGEPPPAASLTINQSVDLRERLVAELAVLDQAAALTEWALKALPRKNRLSNEDALAVEAAFERRLAGLAQTPSAASDESAPGLAPQPRPAFQGHEPVPVSRPQKEVMVLSKPVRDRDRAHLRFVAGRPCLLCGRTPSDPHHIKFAENWTAGRKVSDRFTVPLCRLHHHELHRRGHELRWWEEKGIDPLGIAKTLWAKTHAADPDEVVIDGADYAVLPTQKDETNPIARPEAS